MTCTCDITQQKIDVMEAFLNAGGWAFVHKDGVTILVKRIRDECRYKGTGKTKWCQNDACAAACDFGRIGHVNAHQP